jgi:hypothetical protein
VYTNLKWNTHIDNITSNGNKSLGYLKGNLQISNPEVKSRAYQALVRPKLEYSCSIWDPYTHDNINKLEMVHHLRLDCSVTPRYFAEVTGSRM